KGPNFRKGHAFKLSRQSLPTVGRVNRDLGGLRASMRHRHVEAMRIWREEASTSARGRRRSSDAVVTIRITLPENLHRTFATYDIDQSPVSVVKKDVGITHSRHHDSDSSRSGIQNNQPSRYSASDEQPSA